MSLRIKSELALNYIGIEAYMTDSAGIYLICKFNYLVVFDFSTAVLYVSIILMNLVFYPTCGASPSSPVLIGRSGLGRG
jgi:hypothetical protein